MVRQGGNARPMHAERFPERDERQCPDHAAGVGEQRERPEVHPGNPGGEGGDMPGECLMRESRRRNCGQQRNQKAEGNRQVERRRTETRGKRLMKSAKVRSAQLSHKKSVAPNAPRALSRRVFETLPSGIRMVSEIDWLNAV